RGVPPTAERRLRARRLHPTGTRSASRRQARRRSRLRPPSQDARERARSERRRVARGGGRRAGRDRAGRGRPPRGTRAARVRRAHGRAPVRAYAKITLALVVGPSRADGKHEVVTVLQRIDLADEITLEVADRLAVDGFDDDTLVHAALRSLAEAAGVA